MLQLKVKVNLSTICASAESESKPSTMCALAESESKPKFIRANFTFAIDIHVTSLWWTSNDERRQMFATLGKLNILDYKKFSCTLIYFVMHVFTLHTRKFTDTLRVRILSVNHNTNANYCYCRRVIIHCTYNVLFQTKLKLISTDLKNQIPLRPKKKYHTHTLTNFPMILE